MHLSRIRLRLLLLAAITAAGLSACARPQLDPPPAPVVRTGTATDAELAVYRTVAESIYVRATNQAVAVTRTVMDSTCSGMSCRPIGGVASPRSGAERFEQGSSIIVPQAEERAMRLADAILLDDLGEGARRVVVIDPDDVPLVTADTSTWRYFRGNYGGVAGALRFSPIAFSPSGREATVSVLWRCGPACGHALSVALRARAGEEWEIADIVLVGSGASRE